MRETCSVDGCRRPDYCRGWCSMHYTRWWRTGTTDTPQQSMPFEERFWAKVGKSPDGCWTWMAALDGNGYGKLWNGHQMTWAHRVAYELTLGPVPDGLVIDHICYRPSCVNPSHLQAVTIQQNAENRSGAKPGSRSGVRGVSWNKRKGKWHVRAKSAGREHSAGYFADLAEAEAAAIALRNSLMTNNLIDKQHTKEHA